MPDLEYVTADELLAELAKRYCHFIFCGVPAVNPENTLYCFRLGGNLLVQRGLYAEMGQALGRLSRSVPLSPPEVPGEGS